MPVTRPRVALALALVSLAASIPVPAVQAQGTARSMDIDVSIRSAALGGASNALFWGDEVDHWANPALLGGVNGIHYEHGRTQLVPGLATDVTFTSDVVKLGGAGFGVVMSGHPGNSGGVKLDYGSSEQVDQNGNPIGTFGSYERVRSWGFGVELLHALASLPNLREPLGNATHYLDFSYGMNIKDVTVALAPASASGEASTTARDWGILMRFTPYDGITGSFPLPFRFDVAVGRSVLSSNDDATLTFINEDVANPVSRHEREGWGFHFAYDPPEVFAGPVSGGAWGELKQGFRPLVSVGYTRDHARISAGGQSNYYETDGSGTEIAFAHVFAYRIGHYRDVTGEIDGDTQGWSVGLPIGRWGGALYEEATWPQSQNSGLPDLTRTGWKAWIDPLAIWRSTHAPRRQPAATAVPPIPVPMP